MSKRVNHIRPKEMSLTLQALEEAAKRMGGKCPALTLVEELLTESEKLTLGRRVLISQMMLAGMTQAEIREKLNVSPNTFTRTKKWLLGQIPNYDKALRVSIEAEKARSDARQKKGTSRQKILNKQYAPAHTFRGMRQRYPMHFLLFNIAEELLSSK